MKKKIKKIGRIVKWILAALPMVLGVYGYHVVGGLDWVDSLYSSAALYFVNPTSDVMNIYVMVAEVGALLVAVGVLAQTVSAIYTILRKAPFRIHSKRTAIYSDSEQGRVLATNWSKSILAKSDEGLLKTKEHVIMFDDDLENLQFLNDHMEELKENGDKVYLLLNELDPVLCKQEKDIDVSFFNIYELVARNFWMNRDLYDKNEWEIAILGYGKVGKALFRYAYLTELFSLNQKVTYHIYGAGSDDREFLKGLEFMNDDKVVVHETDYDEEYRSLAKMDLVIVTESARAVDTVQSLLKLNGELEIAYYSETETIFADILNASHVSSFGETKKVLNQDAIQRGLAYRQGMLFNYDYNHREEDADTLPENYLELATSEWRELNGFFKGTNVARAEQYRIRKHLSETHAFTDWELNKIEHTRWARYYFYNGWSYAPVRDNVHKKHHLLIPFEELSDNENSKDGIHNHAIEREINRLVEEGI